MPREFVPLGRSTTLATAMLVLVAWALAAPSSMADPARGAEAAAAAGDSAIDAPFAALADALARSGRAEAADAVRRWVPEHREDQHLAFFPLADFEIPDESLSEPKVTAAFYEARRRAARAAIDAATDAARRGEADLAWRLLWRAVREDPTAEQPRRIVGLATGRAGRVSVRVGREAPPQLGWPPRSFLVAQTPHFRIFSTASRREATALAEDLERFHAVWSQIFRELWVSDAKLCEAIVAGTPVRRSAPPVEVALFADREAYAKALAGDATAATISTGYYAPPARLTLLYAGDDAPATTRGDAASEAANDKAETRYHEITHQLLQETCGPVVETPGLESGFWIVEGIASYMESVRFFDSLATVGGWESPRLQYARYRWLQGQPPPSLPDMAAEGRDAVQGRDDLAAWYSTTAAYTHMLCDNQHTRGGLMRYLHSIYRGRPEPEAIGLEDTSRDWSAKLVQFLRLSDATAPPLRLGTSLRVLCLGRTQLTAERVAAIPPQPQLSWLDLGHLPVADTIVERLAGDPPLERLNLESTRVTDTGARIVVARKSLRELDLSFTEIGDLGIQPLAGSRVEVLWLTGSHVSDESIPLLLSLRHLRSLDVQRTAISREGLQRLTTARPDLQLNPLRLIPPPDPQSRQ